MTTRHLLGWIALFGSAELALQGHWADRSDLFYAGLAALALALALTAWRFRQRQGLAITFGIAAAATLAFASLEWAGAFRFAPSESQVHPPPAKRPSALRSEGSRATLPLSSGALHIVILGASRDDTPLELGTWPARVGLHLASQVSCARPLYVNDVSASGNGIQQTLETLESDLARWSPDLLLFTPSHTDLHSIVEEIPALALDPVIQSPRASALGAYWERKLRGDAAERRFRDAARLEPNLARLRESPLGQAYRELALVTRRQGIELAWLPLSLAIGIDSGEAERQRFDTVDPDSRRFALARPIHELLLRSIGANYRTPVLQMPHSLNGAGQSAFASLTKWNEFGRSTIIPHVSRQLHEMLLTRPEWGCQSLPGVPPR